MTPTTARKAGIHIMPDAYFNRSRLLNLILLISLACFLAMLIMRFITVYSINVDLGGVETNVVFSIQSLTAGLSLYNDPMYVPFTITQYTPLYYYVCATTANWLNINPATDIHAIYVIGRMWNILFNLLSALAIFLICKNIFKLGDKASLIAGLVAFIFTFRLDFSVRPDSIQNMLVLWSTYSFFLYLQTPQNRQRATAFLITAIFLAITSVFAKQSGIQLPIIYVGFLLFTLNWRGFVLAIFGSALFFASYYWYFNHEFGEAFALNVVGGVANGLTLRGFLVWVVGAKPFALKIFIPFLIATYIILRHNFIFKGTVQEKFLAFCLTGFFGFATITGFKMGATAQYYGLFQYMAWVLILYYFLSKKDYYLEVTRNLRFVNLKRYGIWAFLTLLLLINTLYQFLIIKRDEFDGRNSLEQERAITNSVAHYLKVEEGLAPGEKFFAHLTVSDRRGINNALFEHALVPQLEIVNFSMTPLKVFGFDQFDECLKNGTAKFIIESNPRHDFVITNHYEQLRQAHYELIKTIDKYSIYKWKQ